ncbi:MAG: LarC family nickel insertion protein [Clostridiales Family XIII bacterium]|nr:LarC family nickel insertion protein [Clostridiales Family XIII bacterium]
MRKILYFDCVSGISGDMALGALVHLGADFGRLKAELGKLGLAGYEIVKRAASMSGISGVDIDVVVFGGDGAGCAGGGAGCAGAGGGRSGDGDGGGRSSGHAHDHGGAGGHDHSGGHAHDHAGAHAHDHGAAGGHTHDHGGDHAHGAGAHAHNSFGEIREMIGASGISAMAKRMSVDIFTAIAEAEAAVHGVALEDVVFHEVGAVDSIVDIVGAAICVDMLEPDRIMCSTVHDGHGSIECRHGIIPAPVPAVMEMLKGSSIKIVGEDVPTEMVTPTGLGILKGLNAECALMPEMNISGVGYGFGKRDTGRFRGLRAIMGFGM